MSRRQRGRFPAPLNPHANGWILGKMAGKYGVPRRADGVGQTTLEAAMAEDAGTHIPPAHSQ